MAETDIPRSWDRRARAREAFIDAAYRVIDTHGPRPSMNDIAKEAGATKPRLYRHFADKADLYKAIADRTTHDVYKLVAPKFNFLLTTPHEALNHAITGYAEVVAEHPNVFRFLADGELKQDGAGSALSLDVERDLTDRLAGVASTIFESVSAEVSDVRFTARAAVGIMVSTTDLWLESSTDSGKPDTEYFVGQVAPLVWGVLDAFLRRNGIELDPTEPLYLALARINAP
ncbi:TetR/AcrR family transcriptional regulator [Rhodococcus sp. ACPA1]|uniref:TetR/AcrR family transcriptional regulator n=1 Tax=Rhodococcus sp. ACPA1 TaxID=2028572 RepID=UPI00211D0D4D|nr:TetR/AcrR family transcriptional regulator [Rhodococcus sp. ACPA1]